MKLRTLLQVSNMQVAGYLTRLYHVRRRLEIRGCAALNLLDLHLVSCKVQQGPVLPCIVVGGLAEVKVQLLQHPVICANALAVH